MFLGVLENLPAGTGWNLLVKLPLTTSAVPPGGEGGEAELATASGIPKAQVFKDPRE